MIGFNRFEESFIRTGRGRSVDQVAFVSHRFSTGFVVTCFKEFVYYKIINLKVKSQRIRLGNTLHSPSTLAFILFY